MLHSGKNFFSKYWCFSRGWDPQTYQLLNNLRGWRGFFSCINIATINHMFTLRKILMSSCYWLSNLNHIKYQRTQCYNILNHSRLRIAQKGHQFITNPCLQLKITHSNCICKKGESHTSPLHAWSMWKFLGIRVALPDLLKSNARGIQNTITF